MMQVSSIFFCFSAILLGRWFVFLNFSEKLTLSPYVFYSATYNDDTESVEQYQSIYSPKWAIAEKN